MRRVTGFLVIALTLTGLVVGYGTPAGAVSFTGQYYAITNPGPIGVGDVGGTTQSTSPAVNPVCGLFPCFAAQSGSVELALNPVTLLPVAAGGHWSAGNGNDVRLWDAGNPINTVTSLGSQNDVFFDGAGGSTSFLLAQNFWVPGETSNENAYLAVHWSGSFSAPAGATFEIQSDDHAFLYVNQQLVVDGGGIKAITEGPFSGSILGGPGVFTFDLYFSDVFRIQSGLQVSCEGCLDPVPEPTSLLLFGTTLAGLGAVIRRKLQRRPESV